MCSLFSLKANETFAFVGNVTHYTRVWLNISSQLRSFLEEGQFHKHLVWLQQVHLQKSPRTWRCSAVCAGTFTSIFSYNSILSQEPFNCALLLLHSSCFSLLKLFSDLQQHPELINGTDTELMQSLMEGNYSLPNTSTLLEQLDTIDNAACGWTHFMSKVSTVFILNFTKIKQCITPKT